MPGRLLAVAARRPAALTATLLLAVYVATLAPSVTPWDSGEFLSAIRTLGIPHPPGTPLFVFAAGAWASVLRPLDFTVAVNLGSAVATAVAVAILARTFARWRGARAVVAAGLVAGTMTAVWQSATETEVYAYALCLGALLVATGDYAGRAWCARRRLLLAFLCGLAVPLHISALAAGPAAIWLSSIDEGGGWSLRAGLPPLAAWLSAVGLGTVSPVVLVAALVVAATSAILPAGGWGARPRDGATAIGLAFLGASFILVMLVRAQHDPGINQGNPVTWDALWGVVGRAQYDVPPLFPRRAPAWLQVGNVIQYADWQVARGLDDTPGPSLLRTPVTLVFVALGMLGAMLHRRGDPRTFAGLAVLFLCASLGVVVVLNLRAGPSYGWGVLPAGALREARERDYFFGLAFACWGVWSALGLVSLARRLSGGWRRELVWLPAAVPFLLNWSVANRQRLPERSLSGALGRSLLSASPPRAVLVLGGDNDSYAVWYAQQVLGQRSDVIPVTVPLLGAEWYRSELRRRHDLLDQALVERWHGTGETLGGIVAAAAASDLPVALSVGVSRNAREGVGAGWRFNGLVYTRVPGDRVDTDPAAAARLDAEVRGVAEGILTRPAREGTARYIQRLLRCPSAVMGASAGDRTLLESNCNY